jgi:hypothetical protein
MRPSAFRTPRFRTVLAGGVIALASASLIFVAGACR